MGVEEKKIAFNSMSIQLDSVDFKKVKNIETNFDRIKIITKDYFDLVELTKESFTISYERKVELEPKIMFEISVKFDVIFRFGEKTIDEYKDNFEELREVVKEKLEKAIEISNVIPRASAIISSLTLNLNNRPIITPPSLQK